MEIVIFMIKTGKLFNGTQNFHLEKDYLFRNSVKSGKFPVQPEFQEFFGKWKTLHDHWSRSRSFQRNAPWVLCSAYAYFVYRCHHFCCPLYLQFSPSVDQGTVCCSIKVFKRWIQLAENFTFVWGNVIIFLVYSTGFQPAFESRILSTFL